MITYHKIKTVFSRDPKTRFKTIIDGEFAMPEFKFLQNNRWIYTEKVDGANVRVMYDGRAITFGGKTDQAQLQTGLFNRLNDRFLPQVNQFGKIFTGTLDDIKVCLYGEGTGPKSRKVASIAQTRILSCSMSTLTAGGYSAKTLKILRKYLDSTSCPSSARGHCTIWST